MWAAGGVGMGSSRNLRWGKVVPKWREQWGGELVEGRARGSRDCRWGGTKLGAVLGLCRMKTRKWGEPDK